MIIEESVIKTLDLDFLNEFSSYFDEASIKEKPLPKSNPGLETPPLVKTPEPRCLDCGSADILDIFSYPQFESESMDLTNQQLEEVAHFLRKYQQLQQHDSATSTAANQNVQDAAAVCVQTHEQMQHTTASSIPNFEHVQHQTSSSLTSCQQEGPESSDSMPMYQQVEIEAPPSMALYQHIQPVSSSVAPMYQQVQPSISGMMTAYRPNHPMTSYQQHTPPSSNQQHIPPSSYQQQNNLNTPSYQQNTIPSPSYQQQPIPSPSYQQQPVPSPSYHQQPIPSPSYQQPVPSPSYQQQPVLSPSYQQQPVPSPSYQKQPVPSPSYQQQPIPSPSYQQQPVPSPSYQQQPVPSPSYQQQPIPSPSYQQQPIPSPSYQQQPIPSLSYQKQHIPLLSYQKQHIPSPSYQQQHMTFRSYQHTMPSPSLQLPSSQQFTAATSTHTSPASVPVNSTPSTNPLISGMNHQPIEEPTKSKGKGRRSTQKDNESSGVFETPNSPVKKRGRKRTVTSAAQPNGVPDQQPQAKQAAMKPRAARCRPPGKSKKLPACGTVQSNGQAGDANANNLLLSHQQLFPALTQLLRHPQGAPSSNNQLQFAQTFNGSMVNVSGVNEQLRRTMPSVGNSQPNKPLPMNPEQVFYYQANPMNQRNTIQPMSIQNLGQLQNTREQTVFSLDNQRTVIQGFNPGVSSYITAPLVVSGYQNGCLQISPQSSSAVQPVPFVLKHDSNLPQKPFVVNLMTPPESNLTPSPMSSSSTPSPEVLSSFQDYGLLKYRLM